VKIYPQENHLVGQFIREEMESRGWTTRDVAARFTTGRIVSLDSRGEPVTDTDLSELALDFFLTVPCVEMEFSAKFDAKLAQAFGVSRGFFTALHRRWLESVSDA